MKCDTGSMKCVTPKVLPKLLRSPYHLLYIRSIYFSDDSVGPWG